MALVNLSAKIIESCYFLRHFEDQWLLRFHLQPDGLGLFSEGLLAFGADGRIRAANQSALNLLGSPRQRLVGQLAGDVLRLPAGRPVQPRRPAAQRQLAVAHPRRAHSLCAAARPAPHRRRAGAAACAAGERPVPGRRSAAGPRFPPGAEGLRPRRAAVAAGRDRHRQGGLRPRRAPGWPVRGTGVRRAELRGDPRNPDRERAVRLPRRQLHRRAQGRHARQVAAGRRRHPVPRRDR